ncbi:sulfite reductase subunit alpha [bacterium]|nr:MAG: sulfite reductase subunit alpha [bacterium]
MSVPLLPESAPFSAAQRAYLNGFLAGLLHLNDSGKASVAPAQTEASAEDEEFPWHDPALALDERLVLAQEKPFPRVLMAAMAQLDCGSCGYLCQTYAEAIASGADKDLTKCSPGGKETKNKLKELVAKRPADAEVATPAAPKPSSGDGTPSFNRDNPFPSPILQILPLTRKDSQKDVRFVSFGLKGSGLSYEVGDALGVYPENCSELVEDILTELDATGDEPTHSPEGRVIPARVALQAAYVINQVSEEFLEALSGLAARDDDREKLLELAQTDAGNYLHTRDILDVLQDFPSARPRSASHVGFLISKLAPLRPRLYSISSSLKAHPDEVHLTVGMVRYARNGSERARKGVASTFLGDRCLTGQKVGVFVQPSHGFRPPLDPQTPLMMVGPGTGIAPFRAFLEERVALGHSGKNWLFFGAPHRETDYLYQSEIENYLSNGHLSRLDLAFSRDQAEKIYVQDKMLQNGAEIWKWLDEGGHFTVCGDASRMAKDVDNALHTIVATHGNLGDDGARDYIAQMSRAGRYGRDVY